MSCRRPAAEKNTSEYATQLRAELQELKTAAAVSSPPPSTDAIRTAPGSGGLTFEDLSHTEQACASLGAAPEDFRPLGWLNAGHYEALVKSNQMDGDLVRRLEAYKVVANRAA